MSLWAAGVFDQVMDDPFIDFMHYLFPDNGDAEWMLGHIAMKAQDPCYRGLAILMTTPTQGTGRGTLEHILSRLWGDWNVSCGISIKKFVDAVENNANNAWMGTDWIIVSEAVDATVDKRQDKLSYTALKSFITPDVISFKIRDKWVTEFDCDINASTIIASQDEDCINIEAKDRRFVHLRNPTIARDKNDYFGPLTWHKNAWMKSGFEPHVWRWLLERDLSNFDPFYEARREVTSEESIEQQMHTGSPVDVLVALALGYIDKECAGICYIPLVEKWVAHAGNVLYLPDGWQGIFRKKMRNQTRPFQDEKGAPIKMRIGDKSGFQVRYTATEKGDAVRYEVEQKSCRGRELATHFEEKHVGSFLTYVTLLKSEQE